MISEDVRSASLVTTQSPVTVTGSIQRDLALGTPGKIAWNVNPNTGIWLLDNMGFLQP